MAYNKPSIGSGFNDNPPPDDGTEVTSNEVTWSKHLTKLANPLKAYIDAVNDAVQSRFNVTPDYSQTQAEIDAGVTPSDTQYPPGDIRRYGGADDGATDNTTPLQNAHDALPSTGGTIKFPSEQGSTYQFTGSVTFSKPARLVGTTSVTGDLVYTGTGTFITTGSQHLVLRDLAITGQFDGDQVYTSGSILIDPSGVVRAYNCEFSKAETLFAYSGGFYHKFFDCTFARAKTLFSGWNANNVYFSGCRWHIFEDGFEANSGSGPVVFVGGSIEDWYNHAFRQTGGARYVLSVFGAYFENPDPDEVTPDGIGPDDDTYGDGDPVIAVGTSGNAAALTMIGNYINLRGLSRIAAMGSTADIYSRNTLSATTGVAGDYLNSNLYQVTTDSSLNLKDSLGGSLFGGTYCSSSGNRDSTIYDPVAEAWVSAEHIGRIAPQTFSAADTTPSVAFGHTFLTDSGTYTITDFDDGHAGQEITVISKGAVTFDTTGTNLTGSSVDIVTASGDVTRWLCEDGTTWRLIAYVDASADNSGGA